MHGYHGAFVSISVVGHCSKSCLQHPSSHGSRCCVAATAREHRDTLCFFAVAQAMPMAYMGPFETTAKLFAMSTQLQAAYYLQRVKATRIFSTSS